MSLYNEWTEMVVEYVKTKGEDAFWSEYSLVESQIYSKVLANHDKKIKGVFSDLSKEHSVSDMFFMGFLDGVNDSLLEPLDLESLEQSTELDIDIDFEALYFNMLEAKADYLYELPQWDGVFSKEKRKEICTKWKSSKTVVNEAKIGRNDPCPCGSGKKYKKCCGAA